jgi:hypothetical protein
MLKVTIETENAAFEDTQAELSRILRELATEIDKGLRQGGQGWQLRDVNGNRVGNAIYTEVV